MSHMHPHRSPLHRITHHAAVAALLLAVGLTAAGCASAPKPLTVDTAGNKFNPSTLEVHAGGTTVINFTGIADPHTFTVSPWNVNETLSPPEATVTFTVPSTAKGDVTYFCGVHVGMTGTLRVK